jgi:hypothetical protein
MRVHTNKIAPTTMPAMAPPESLEGCAAAADELPAALDCALTMLVDATIAGAEPSERADAKPCDSK